MQKEAVFQLLNEKVVFQGVAVRDFKEGIFCGLFTIKDTPFILDGLRYDQNGTQTWDVGQATLYHYTIPEAEKEHTCPFCSYAYEAGKALQEDLVCVQLNAEPFINAIWGSCICSETFDATFRELVKQLNPKGIKAM